MWLSWCIVIGATILSPIVFSSVAISLYQRNWIELLENMLWMGWIILWVVRHAEKIWPK